MDHDPIVIVGAARTPMGGFQGDFAGTPAATLGAAAITGALTGVTGEVLARAIWYWKSIDPTVGARIEANVNAR